MSDSPHIVLIGAGFAALAAARALRRLRPHARIRLIAPTRHFVYRPSLIWVPIGLRKASQIEVPLAPFLAKHAMYFTPATVTGIVDRGRTVLTSLGPVRNDALIVATGASFGSGLDGAGHALSLCEGVGSAERVRARLLAMQGGRIAIGCGENPHQAGATRCGPMLELLFGIDTWLRRRGKRAQFALSFFSTCGEPFESFGKRAAERLQAELDRRDIESSVGLALRGFSPTAMLTEGGSIAAEMIVFTPGLSGPSWLAESELPRSSGGFVAADDHCAVSGLDLVFAAGDVGSFPGPAWSPKLAHMAHMQASVAAANLDAALNEKPQTSRLHHELACVIDTLDGGFILYRDEAHAIASPPAMPLHWAKRTVERRYLSSMHA